MYCQFYGFRDKPFSLLPDPDFLFLSPKHEKALNLLELGILNQSGFCVISGEIGAGKTTLVRELLNRLDDHVQVGLISNTHLAISDILSWVLSAYKIESESSEPAFQHRLFSDFVIEQYAGGKHTLLIIDEAQNLSVSALEQLRMLSNINSEKDLLLQIILVGQSELRTNLQRPELEQFAQRIAIDYHLAALDQEETVAYIGHRLIKSGGSQQLFDDAARSLVYQYSGGIPRLINRICDLGLVYGFSADKKIIGADLISAVTKEQEIGRLIKASTESPASTPPSSLLSLNSRAFPASGTTTVKKATPEPAPRRSIGGSKPSVKESEKTSKKMFTSPSDKGMKARQTHEANSAIYTAADTASAEKFKTESVATEKNGASRTAAEKSKADAAFVEKIEAEKLFAEALATEKAAAEKAAAALAEASTTAANLAESEKLAAEKAALKATTAIKQAADSISQKKQAAEKLVAEKAHIEKEALEIAAAAKSVADKTLAERVAAEKAAAEKAATADAAVRKAAADRVAAEKAVASAASESETAEKRTLARKADAERMITEKAAADKAASDKAHADKILAKKASAERTAADTVVQEKSVEAKQAAQKAAASRAAAEKSLAEKIAAEKLAKEKASLEKVALAKVAVSAAADAQRAAAEAAAARTAAQKEASEKETAAVEAARKAAEASAFAEKAQAAAENRTPTIVAQASAFAGKAQAAAENRTPIGVTGLTHDKKPEKSLHSVLHQLAGAPPPVPMIPAKQPRRIRSILAVSLISGMAAASIWLITEQGGMGADTSPALAAGESFATDIPMTEAAALKTSAE